MWRNSVNELYLQAYSTFSTFKPSTILSSGKDIAPVSKCRAWASAEIFPGGGNVAKVCCPFQLADDANRRSQNALPLLHHKERVPCYDSSHKNAFVGSSQARESEICFQRGANQSRISRPPYPNCGARCHKGPKFTAVATEGLLWA